MLPKLLKVVHCALVGYTRWFMALVRVALAYRQNVVRRVEAYWEKMSESAPPPNLRARVHGSPDLSGFWVNGQQAASDLKRTSIKRTTLSHIAPMSWILVAAAVV